jgi:hypothetical protein
MCTVAKPQTKSEKALMTGENVAEGADVQTSIPPLHYYCRIAAALLCR